MVFNREAFEKFAKSRTLIVPTALGDVRLRAITAQEQLDLLSQFGEKPGPEQRGAFASALLACSVIDEGGENFLKPEEVHRTFPAGEVFGLMAKAIDLSGIGVRAGTDRKNVRASRRR